MIDHDISFVHRARKVVQCVLTVARSQRAIFVAKNPGLDCDVRSEGLYARPQGAEGKLGNIVEPYRLASQSLRRPTLQGPISAVQSVEDAKLSKFHEARLSSKTEARPP